MKIISINLSKYVLGEALPQILLYVLMSKSMKSVPLILIYSRAIIAVLIGLIALFNPDHTKIAVVTLMSLGLLTDIFDGIIARSLNVSTQKLRVLDSNVDQFFWITTIFAIFYLNQDFIKANYGWILIVLFLEFSAYMLSFLKFKKSIATHSFLAKIWTLSLLGFLIDLCLNSWSIVPFIVCISLGFLSRVEIILIILKLKNWTTDVPSVFSVARINRGETVRKNRILNG